MDDKQAYIEMLWRDLDNKDQTIASLSSEVERLKELIDSIEHSENCQCPLCDPDRGDASVHGYDGDCK